MTCQKSHHLLFDYSLFPPVLTLITAALIIAPAVYVGTWHKYNGGSIAGRWLRIPLYSITDWHRSPISDSHPFDQPGT
ncbi:hypothetical protein [Escherichia coli]|uniref:hypothetical protein n=1 Tax=Escherichia coli TaxID=562 RepID=UPI003B519C6E